MKFQRFFGDGMMKTQTGCMQRLSGNPLHIGIIEGISDQRIAQIFHMDPDLVVRPVSSVRRTRLCPFFSSSTS